MRESDHLATSQRYFPAGSLSTRAGVQWLNPQQAGWKYSGLAIITVQAGQLLTIDPNILRGAESALIPLNTQNVRVTVDSNSYELVGRPGVFAGATDWLFISPNSNVNITSSVDGEIALATSIAESDFPTKYVAALDVVEIRGAADATREVRPFMHPDHFSDASHLMAVELVTPDGNVSSYPPHRHDGIGECKVNNEEIYYFRIGKVGDVHGDPEGFGFHRTYSAPEDPNFFDDSVTIHDGDIYLVPRGYHGPCVAMPGYPMYYLNVLAGETSPRSMDFCDDPNHGWIRTSWQNEVPDPRVPWRVKP